MTDRTAFKPPMRLDSRSPDSGTAEEHVQRPIARRPANEAEQSGRRYLARACITVVVGGLITAGLSSGIFADLVDSTIGTLGMLIGLGTVALGLVAYVDAGRSKMMAGAIVIVLAVLSLPFTFGGLVVGALCSIVGGALLVAYEPPIEVVEIQTQRGNRLRRAIALVVDFVIVFCLHVYIGRFLPGVSNGASPSNTIAVLISWLLWWSLALAIPAVVFRQTPGRTLMGLRLVDASGERPSLNATLLREVIRGLITVGTFIVAGRVFSNHGFWSAMLVVWVTLAIVSVSELTNAMERVTKSVSGYDLAVYTGVPLVADDES